jgi:hypothetical protein
MRIMILQPAGSVETATSRRLVAPDVEDADGMK